MIEYPEIEFDRRSLFEPIDPFATSIADAPVSNTPTVETPTPTISYPSDWEYAAAQNEPVKDADPVEDLAWETQPVKQTNPEPTIVLNKYEDHGSTAVLPVDLYPVDAYEVPMKEPIFNCVTEPCDGGVVYFPQKIDPMPLPYEVPAPIVDGPLDPGKITPVDPPVSQPYPVVNVTVATQTPTTQQVAPAGDAADGETPMIFGYPWYYAVGAGVAALFLFSSMDGKK